MAPKLGLSEEVIQWLNETEQPRGNFRRRKRNALYNVDTSVDHRFRRQAPSNQREQVRRVWNQESGVEIYVQVFLNHGDEARNENLDVIVNLPIFQPADINEPPKEYKHNMTVKILVCSWFHTIQK